MRLPERVSFLKGEALALAWRITDVLKIELLLIDVAHLAAGCPMSLQLAGLHISVLLVIDLLYGITGHAVKKRASLVVFPPLLLRLIQHLLLEHIRLIISSGCPGVLGKE